MFDQQGLAQIANYEMPFSRYKNTPLIQLPEAYLLWFVDRDFPTGKLGELMQMTLEIKINGLENLIYPLQKAPKKKQPTGTKFTFE